ncbi:MAG: hypothetical protein K9M75_04510 [Phycisphaerae bacterium]|nr:hypothetical protein [Phycisphaerae bacterium]
MSSKTKIVGMTVFLIICVFLLSGCFIPAVTHCKGDVSIQNSDETLRFGSNDGSERFVVISFWEYPMVNSKPGKVVVNDVFVTNDLSFEVKFPPKGYWVVWMVALGVQHIAPEPGIMVIHKDYPASWDVGGTWEGNIGVCCQKPVTKRDFHINLKDLNESLLFYKKSSVGTKLFLEEFIDEGDDIIKKMEKYKSMTDEERQMVLDKISETMAAFEIKNSD